jgi:hypothetical protein
LLSMRCAGFPCPSSRSLLLSGTDTDRQLSRGARPDLPDQPGPAPATTRGQPRAGRTTRRDPPPRARPDRGSPRAQGQPRPTADHRQRHRPRIDRTSWHRPGQRHPGHVSFAHPGRCRNDAAFAALAGASPLPASSGRTVRPRLNRGGDRALNHALHTIATTRMRSCPTSRGLRRAPHRPRQEPQGNPPPPHWGSISTATGPLVVALGRVGGWPRCPEQSIGRKFCLFDSVPAPATR